MENLLSESSIRQLVELRMSCWTRFQLATCKMVVCEKHVEVGLMSSTFGFCVSSVDSGRVWERSDNISDVFFVGVSVTPTC